MNTLATFTSAILIGSATAASAVDVLVTVTHLNTTDFSFTPAVVGFHDGSVDFFDPGGMASNNLEILAEDGMTGGLVSDIEAAGGQAGVATFGAPPILEPGEAGSFTLTLDTANRFLSFATMVVPTNDAFLANNNPTAFEILDADGNFIQDFAIVLLDSQIWDAGTELNNGEGAAFQNARQQTDTAEAIALLDPATLDAEFLNEQDATGRDLLRGLAGAGSLISIEVTQVPEPSSTLLAALAGLGLLGRRRR